MSEVIAEEDFVAYEKWCEANHRLPWCHFVDPSPGNVEKFLRFEDGGCCSLGPAEIIIHIRQAPYEQQKRYIDRWKTKHGS